MRLLTILKRSFRLRCPVCGGGRLFRGWFRMHPTCEQCGLKYDRAPGYFLGSIYINYGVTSLLVVLLYFSLYFADILAPLELLSISATLSVVFPIWFFRYARSFWMGFDEYFDPIGKHDKPGKNETSPRDAK